MSQEEYTPMDTVTRAFRRWWLVFLLMLVGGIAGWAISFLRGPVYEASATINASMEVDKWISSIPDNEQALTFLQFQEDSAFLSAEMIMESTAVKTQVLQALAGEGIQADLAGLNKKVSLERYRSEWVLRARDRDPETAARIANAWAEKSLAAVQAAWEHAQRAGELEGQIASLAKNYTNGSNDAEIAKLTDELAQEKKASGGILSIMDFNLADEAQTPAAPIASGRALSTLAGALVGLLLSLWVVSLPKVGGRG